jgi:CubicO group peptidase (beta-lactamase class C family)
MPIAGALDEFIARAMDRIQVPGLSVAVYSRDGIYARGFGVTDVTTGEHVDADTAFYIASTTKPLTALAVASLLARHELDLNVTLSAFAPDAPFPAAVRPAEVRLRDLLSHTSGLGNGPIGFRVAFTGQHSPDLLWRLLSRSTVNEDAPLGRFDYTNSGYNIATVLTHRRFGTPWQELLQREVFGPVGMRRASAMMSRAAEGSWPVARPHALLPEGLAKLYLEKTDRTMQSAGGVIMSANDAARWLELMIEDGAVGGRQIVPAALVRSTRMPLAATVGDFAGFGYEGYGLGWYHGRYRDEPVLHHTGGFSGMSSHVSYIPGRHIGVAAFANEYNAARLTDAVAGYVYDLTAGRSDAATRFQSQLDVIATRRARFFERIAADRTGRAGRPWNLTRPRAAYGGVYENGNYGRIEIVVERDGLAVVFGALRATAEPFTNSDTIRVEFLPFDGEPIVFGGAGASPDHLRYDDETYTRV